jgi:hypothetical protein
MSVSTADKLTIQGDSLIGYNCEAPVLFIVFNRPELTILTLDAISKAKPRKLYVACDGPRNGNVEDVHNVDKVKGIIKKIDWKCDVKYLFNEKNLGCGRGPANAISWFLSQEESGIIIEDDCVTSLSFFAFCESMLEKYRFNENIMSIAGTNICKGVSYETDYVFTNFPLMWGWATWRRAWNRYDFEISDWPKVKAKGSFSELSKDRWKFHPVYVEFFNKTYDTIRNSNPTVWDHQWIFSHWNKAGLTVISTKNLVSNIGFGNDATHTLNDDLGRGNMNSYQHLPPYQGPKIVEEHKPTDRYISKNWFTATYYFYIKILLLRVKPILICWNAVKYVFKKNRS